MSTLSSRDVVTAPRIERVVVLNDFSTGGGGAAALAMLSAAHLRARGLNVTYVTGDDGSDFSVHDVDLFAFGAKPLLTSPAASMLSGLYNHRCQTWLEAWIARHDTPCTVFHLHNWSQIFSPSVFAALRCVADRVVISAHDFFLACPNGAYAIYPKHSVCPLVPLSLRCVATNCDRRSYVHKLWRVARQVAVNALRDLGRSDVPIVAIHEAMVPFLARAGIEPQRIKIARNPAVPYSTTRVKVERNSEFLFIGRLHEGKGPDLAAAAARAANVPLRLLGDGPMRPDLKRDFPEARLLGWLSREEMLHWIRSARAVVVPSRYPEPFGLVALEAIWSGIPVVIASSAFLAPEIEALGVGRACDPHDTGSLAATLKDFAQNDALVQQMSMRGFTHAASLGTTPSEWVDLLTRIYRERLPSTSGVEIDGARVKRADIVRLP